MNKLWLWFRWRIYWLLLAFLIVLFFVDVIQWHFLPLFFAFFITRDEIEQLQLLIFIFFVHSVGDNFVCNIEKVSQSNKCIRSELKKKTFFIASEKLFNSNISQTNECLSMKKKIVLQKEALVGENEAQTMQKMIKLIPNTQMD